MRKRAGKMGARCGERVPHFAIKAITLAKCSSSPMTSSPIWVQFRGGRWCSGSPGVGGIGARCCTIFHTNSDFGSREKANASRSRGAMPMPSIMRVYWPTRGAAPLRPLRGRCGLGSAWAVGAGRIERGRSRSTHNGHRTGPSPDRAKLAPTPAGAQCVYAGRWPVDTGMGGRAVSFAGRGPRDLILVASPLRLVWGVRPRLLDRRLVDPAGSPSGALAALLWTKQIS